MWRAKLGDPIRPKYCTGRVLLEDVVRSGDSGHFPHCWRTVLTAELSVLVSEVLYTRFRSTKMWDSKLLLC